MINLNNLGKLKLWESIKINNYLTPIHTGKN